MMKLFSRAVEDDLLVPAFGSAPNVPMDDTAIIEPVPTMNLRRDKADCGTSCREVKEFLGRSVAIVRESAYIGAGERPSPGAASPTCSEVSRSIAITLVSFVAAPGDGRSPMAAGVL